jgi:putative tryptophan/tyrosine transport system substrate-binding protein
MRRREFITLLGGPAMWPLAARAQQPGRPPTIGFLGAISPTGLAKQLAGFRQGLRDLGYVEGENLTVEYRWAEGRYELLPDLATELVRANVAVIVTHGTPGTVAAKRTTTVIPIVAAIIGDPVATGVVMNIARPDGNITGQTFFNPELRAKRIEFLKEAMPGLAEVAVLVNPDSPAIGPEGQVMQAMASSLGVRLQRYPTRSVIEFEGAFDKIAQAGLSAVEIGDDALMNANVGVLAALAAKRRIVSIGPAELGRAGGLIGYGVDFPVAFRRAPIFVDKILRGAKLADLPFERATRFEFVINLKTAKALGIDVPTATLLRADEVIE